MYADMINFEEYCITLNLKLKFGFKVSYSFVYLLAIVMLIGF